MDQHMGMLCMIDYRTQLHILRVGPHRAGAACQLLSSQVPDSVQEGAAESQRAVLPDSQQHLVADALDVLTPLLEGDASPQDPPPNQVLC